MIHDVVAIEVEMAPTRVARRAHDHPVVQAGHRSRALEQDAYNGAITFSCRLLA
jgi:hypothetical protein